ncbi:MAG: two-component system nitrate/nitrite response regulator NarL [Salibacteraceae bacterium]|jgi:two-component system nitrate/nitrite response regulator NarL
MQRKNFSIVIADDHPLLLGGLKEQLLSNHYNVVAEASNGIQALEIILKLKPTLAFLDIEMPLLTGLEVIKLAKEKESETKFIALSFHKEPIYVAQAKALQISGYLLKEDSFLEIEKCMEAVLEGREFFSNSFDTFSLKNASVELKKLQLLTPSEITILKLIAQQKTTAAIAGSLSVSSRTIEKHRSNIKLKLAIEGRTNVLTKWCLAHKNIALNL